MRILTVLITIHKCRPTAIVCAVPMIAYIAYAQLAQLVNAPTRVHVQSYMFGAVQLHSRADSFTEVSILPRAVYEQQRLVIRWKK